MKLTHDQRLDALSRLVGRFMGAMHRYDVGRTLPLLHAEKVTTHQIAVLEFVRAPQTVSGVARHVGLSRSATSQMINKLVRRRLVRRSEGKIDRREKSVELDKSGVALLKKISRSRLTRFAVSLAILSPRVAGHLALSLEDVVAELDKAPEKPAHPLTRRKGRP